MINARRGFTIIEILITLVVMAGLMALGVVLVGNMQAQARDKERESDVQTIARGIEWRYENKNPVVTNVPNPAMLSNFGYIGTNELRHANGITNTNITPNSSVPYLTKNFKGTTDANFVSPNGGALKEICTGSGCTGVLVTNLTSVGAAIDTAPGDNYVYAPADSNNNICQNGNCTKFILYYRSEVDGTIKSVKSKRN